MEHFKDKIWGGHFSIFFFGKKEEDCACINVEAITGNIQLHNKLEYIY